MTLNSDIKKHVENLLGVFIEEDLNTSIPILRVLPRIRAGANLEQLLGQIWSVILIVKSQKSEISNSTSLLHLLK